MSILPTKYHYIKVRVAILDDYAWTKLPDALKWETVWRAAAGEVNEASPYVTVGRDRAYNSAWRRIRAAILSTAKRCGYCGCEDGPWEVDHRVPLARGGSDDEENLVAACRRCNRSKGGKLIFEWRPA